MRVAGRDRIADAEELEQTFGVAVQHLRPAGEEVVLRHLSEVRGQGPEREIELVERDRAMVDHHLIEAPALCYAAIVAADVRDELIALFLDRFQAVSDG